MTWRGPEQQRLQTHHANRIPPSLTQMHFIPGTMNPAVLATEKQESLRCETRRFCSDNGVRSRSVCPSAVVQPSVTANTNAISKSAPARRGMILTDVTKSASPAITARVGRPATTKCSPEVPTARRSLHQSNTGGRLSFLSTIPAVATTGIAAIRTA